MFLSPLYNQAQGFCGEFPFHHTKILNQNSSLVLVVLDMKMRGLCSLKYIWMTIPRKQLISGIHPLSRSVRYTAGWITRNGSPAARMPARIW